VTPELLATDGWVTAHSHSHVLNVLSL
jgi:hypothetical protein